ncbi:leucine_Rich Repeat (LRR)-containing protein [Hexamita inflata]|uniref:Leucine Rich Repeat (LRR)-containing protein n=2 Tax=Hexamita inflata TaxID=28002 RepID=A0AA86NIL1_9EUKA|nr:leucine Rich Repeat (LRR)-containing protein [Hexamita inflata]
MSHLAIRNKADLRNHFCSQQKLEIINIQQLNVLLKIQVTSDVWEDALKRDLLSFNQEFIHNSKSFKYSGQNVRCFNLISFLSNLSTLDLSYNKISDISAISNLKCLKYLDLSFNDIEDISALETIPSLTELHLYSNKISSYTISLPNLIDFSLGMNVKLQDKSGIQQSPNLLYLNLTGTNTVVNTIPYQLFNLIKLVLTANKITELTYISNFVEIQSLFLNVNQQLQNIEPLKYCTQLTELDMSFTDVADIWPLQFMKNLKSLTMSTVNVIDLHPLQYLYKLEYVRIPHAQVIDVSPISNLPNIKQLSLMYNKIQNWDPIKHHKNFSKLMDEDRQEYYELVNQTVPLPDEIKFYDKIMSVHSSHKLIRQIMNQNRKLKFRTSLTQTKSCFSAVLNNQIMTMNLQLEMLVKFIQNDINQTTNYLD